MNLCGKMSDDGSFDILKQFIPKEIHNQIVNNERSQLITIANISQRPSNNENNTSIMVANVGINKVIVSENEKCQKIGRASCRERV